MDLLEGLTLAEDEKSPSAVTQIVKGVKRMIVEQNIGVGDKLPNEFELSERFGKSRGCVREAVKILESYGVLEIRRGDGTYVRASAGAGMFDALFFQIIAKGTNLSDLIQLRQILESGVMKLVIAQVNEEQIAQLYAVEKELQEAVSGRRPIEELVAYDLQFHKRLVEITGNEILKNVYLNMLDIFTPFIHYSYIQQQQGGSYTVLPHHELILRAVYERDCNLAQYAIRNSLRDWEELNRQYDQTQGR